MAETQHPHQSIWTRKRDLVYLVFFVVHLVVMLALDITLSIHSFDLTTFYPRSLTPTWMSALRTWYISTYADRFFYAPPPYFPLYTHLELLTHLPLTLWLIPALLRHDPRTPLVLLVFALETTITTLTCLADVLSWEELSRAQRGWRGLGGMYGAYAAVGVFMAADSYARLDRVLSRAKGIEPARKKEA